MGEYRYLDGIEASLLGYFEDLWDLALSSPNLIFFFHLMICSEYAKVDW